MNGVVAPAQLDPGLVRLAGAAFVGLLVVVILYFTFWLGESSEDPVYEDEGESGIVSFGPAYGATGTQDVEEVLEVGGRRPETDAERDDGGDADRDAPTADDRETPAPTVDGQVEDLGAIFSHEVLRDGPGELLVEVTDGDRTGRFRLEDLDGEPTVSPAYGSGIRRDSDWRELAGEYLRSLALAGELGRNTGPETERS